MRRKLAMTPIRLLRARRWRVPRLLWRAYRLWDREDCVDLSAAFAYHSLQSLFPILLIALGVASRVLGRVDGLTDNLLDLAEQVLPPSVLPVVSSTLMKLYRQGTGAGIAGAVFLLISATNAYLSLQRGADRLWGFRPVLQPPATWLQPVVRFLRARVESFGLVVLIGFFVVVDQVTTSLRLLSPGSWRRLLEAWMPASIRLWMPLPLLVDVGLSLLIACCLSFALLALLPTRPVPRGPLVPGAVLIGCSLTALNAALGRSLISLSTRFQAYGVISSVLVLSLWVWLVALIVYYGMAVSVVCSRRGQGGRSAPPWGMADPSLE
ncbi:MAG: YihY/virulence factor BrkB family protein [Vulcanococcus sp.]